MLEKTIRQVIRKKINQWTETIEDKSVVRAIEEDLIITGGCIPSMILNEQPKDYDCYLRTKKSVLKVAEYYVNKWNEHRHQTNQIGESTKVFVLDGASPSQELLSYYNIEKVEESKSRMIANTPPERVKIIFPSDGVVGDPAEARANEELGSAVENVEEIDEQKADEIIEKEKQRYFPVFLSSNAITLSNGIQIIVRFYGEPDEIHNTFDFDHAKGFYDNKEGTLSIPPIVYETTINKTLRYSGSKYPVCSLFRMRKFIARGWSINAGQILKIAMQVSELNLSDIDVLEDQLVGVDSLYFMALIQQFQRQKEKDPDFSIDSGYIMTVVDRIF